MPSSSAARPTDPARQRGGGGKRSISAIRAGPPGAGLALSRPRTAHGPLRKDLQRWLTKARLAGLDEESIEALFMNTFRNAAGEDVA